MRVLFIILVNLANFFFYALVFSGDLKFTILQQAMPLPAFIQSTLAWIYPADANAIYAYRINPVEATIVTFGLAYILVVWILFGIDRASKEKVSKDITVDSIKVSLTTVAMCFYQTGWLSRAKFTFLFLGMAARGLFRIERDLKKDYFDLIFDKPIDEKDLYEDERLVYNKLKSVFTAKKGKINFFLKEHDQPVQAFYQKYMKKYIVRNGSLLFFPVLLHLMFGVGIFLKAIGSIHPNSDGVMFVAVALFQYGIFNKLVWQILIKFNIYT
ncbi:MAG: hypothetical protein D6767_06095, partial [Candidatus Hydrogenedentota bacterium]